MQFISDKFSKYKGGKVGLSGLTDVLLCVYINDLNQQNRDLLVVASTLYEANEFYQLLTKYNDNVFLFPMDDFLTTEALAISPDLKINRLETINSLIAMNNNKIVVTHLMGYLRYLPEVKIWKNSIIKINVGQEVKKEALINKLYNIGYELNTIVNKTGELGVRGFVIDVFPINENNPVRIEFWGDTIDSIRYFNLESQLSIGNVDGIIIYPYDEFLIEVESDREIIKNQKYLPIYNKSINNISDYLNEPIVFFKNYNKIKSEYIELNKEIEEYRQRHREDQKIKYMFTFENISNSNEIYDLKLDNVHEKLILDRFDNYNSLNIVPYAGDFNNINKDIKKYIEIGKRVILCLENHYQVNKLIPFLESKYVITNEKDIRKDVINIIKKPLTKGYIFNNYVIISSSDLFNSNAQRANIYKTSFKYGTKIKSLDKLKLGDYVVHNIHGIGVYNGLETLDKNGIKKDYLKINYKGNDKLYIPVEKMEMVAKYSSNEGFAPRIYKLGGTEWQKTKMRIRQKVKDIADNLLRLSAIREAKKGYAFSKDTEEQLLFEMDFMHEETADQITAIKQIKEDMEKESPMDRLLCGDVGYGKTEVAFRAIFKAIMDSKQVAYLCPTTILSHQHYLSAKERFKRYPVHIELINRFTPKGKVKEIIENLKNGYIDLIIGTHRLLSKDVSFKDLGLLVIDEEQRFGVTQKEKIKEYKNNIDILTLSATPIPRTMQMALVGLRNLSLIETPPKNRFPVQTYVLEYNKLVIKEAIYKEIARNGQVFFLCNRISSIDRMVNDIKQLVKEARVTYAHGQMGKREIEERMIKFINNEYNVLVCTTIIETGIDIPNANTLIITDADYFGLSQLYQIRGRVGRSDKIAYAYLMYKKDKILNNDAFKRLEAIKEFTELGSGYAIAMRDLSIRGAGDILGSEQAGFIDSVGIDLYLKMLNEEVDKLNGVKIKKEVQLDEKPLLNVETHIADEYVLDDNLKIEIHQQINEIDSYDKLNEVLSEIEDRFGKVNESIYIYMHQEWFEKMASIIGIEKVNNVRNNIELILDSESSSKYELNNLFEESIRVSDNFKFDYQKGKIKIIFNTNNLSKHWLLYINEYLENIINCRS